MLFQGLNPAQLALFWMLITIEEFIDNLDTQLRIIHERAVIVPDCVFIFEGIHLR
jgi:hypothetical protein